MTARWNAGETARLLRAELDGSPECGFDAVTTDSRESAEGVAFFALDGTQVRGAEFASAAFGAGCSVVVVPRDWSGDVPAGRAALRCDDPRDALAGLAASVRDAWNCPVVSITGSSGKTSVKEMTAHVLGDRALLTTPGNYNTLVGLALTLLRAGSAPDLCVLEVGASLPGEIARLAGFVRPTAACVTNVGPAHLEGFGSVAAVAREKVSLLRTVPGHGLRIVDGDDEVLLAAAAGLSPFRVGFGADNDLRAADAELDVSGSRFRLSTGERGELAVPGRHQIKNALFALAFGREHGVPVAEGLERLRSFSGVPGRLATHEHDGVTIVDDAYNANPSSVRAALAWFAGVEAAGRKAIALGDMLELGRGSTQYHREIGAEVAALAPDLAVFCGEEMRAGFLEACRRSNTDSGFRHVVDSLEAARVLRDWARADDLVLVKGSRGARMDRVVRALRGEDPA